MRSLRVSGPRLDATLLDTLPPDDEWGGGTGGLLPEADRRSEAAVGSTTGDTIAPPEELARATSMVGVPVSTSRPSSLLLFAAGELDRPFLAELD